MKNSTISSSNGSGSTQSPAQPGASNSSSRSLVLEQRPGLERRPGILGTAPLAERLPPELWQDITHNLGDRTIASLAGTDRTTRDMLLPLQGYRRLLSRIDTDAGNPQAVLSLLSRHTEPEQAQGTDSTYATSVFHLQSNRERAQVLFQLSRRLPLAVLGHTDVQGALTDAIRSLPESFQPRIFQSLVDRCSALTGSALLEAMRRLQGNVNHLDTATVSAIMRGFVPIIAAKLRKQHSTGVTENLVRHLSSLARGRLSPRVLHRAYMDVAGAIGDGIHKTLSPESTADLQGVLDRLYRQRRRLEPDQRGDVASTLASALFRGGNDEQFGPRIISQIDGLTLTSIGSRTAAVLEASLSWISTTGEEQPFMALALARIAQRLARRPQAAPARESVLDALPRIASLRLEQDILDCLRSIDVTLRHVGQPAAGA